jgi:hypothetical protein
MGYINPAAFGLISQIGYLLLFAIVSSFLFFFKPLKRMFGRLFKRQPPSVTREEPTVGGNLSESSQENQATPPD